MKKTFAIAILLASGSVLASTAAPEASWSQSQAAADQTVAPVQVTRLNRSVPSVAKDDNRQIMKMRLFCAPLRARCLISQR